MEPGREEVEGLMRRNGLTEKEAEAAYHLRRAKELFEELYAAEDDDPARGFVARVYNDIHFGHFGALNRYLAMRVVRRDHPKGWGQQREPDEQS
jgi:signal transduction histidine kinase